MVGRTLLRRRPPTVELDDSVGPHERGEKKTLTHVMMSDDRP